MLLERKMHEDIEKDLGNCPYFEWPRQSRYEAVTNDDVRNENNTVASTERGYSRQKDDPPLDVKVVPECIVNHGCNASELSNEVVGKIIDSGARSQMDVYLSMALGTPL